MQPAGKLADVRHLYSSWSECWVVFVFGFKLAARVASLFPDFQSLVSLERKKKVSGCSKHGCEVWPLTAEFHPLNTLLLAGDTVHEESLLCP